MNKQEKIIVAVLFVVLLGWMLLQQKLMPARPLPKPAVAEQVAPAVTNELVTERQPVALVAAPTQEVAAVNAAVPAFVAAEPEVPRDEEVKLLLTNQVASITVSSWGAGITSVELKKYRARLDPASEPMVLDYSAKPALAMTSIKGLTTNTSFKAFPGEDARSVRFAAQAGDLAFERTLELGDNYLIQVTDTFRNQGQAPLVLPSHGVGLGPMASTEASAATMGISYIGIDTLEDTGGAEVKYWGGKEIPQFFGSSGGYMSCARPNTALMPAEVIHRADFPVSWAAAKNKFFVEIFAPESAGAGVEIQAARNTNTVGVFTVGEVSADLLFSGRELQPGESFSRKATLYAGPKEYSSLKVLPERQIDVMEFGWWEWFRWICKILLITLNGIYSVIPNYGVAVILLTVIVRLLFWPVTHKSNVSMKKMQAIQPLVVQVREKFKDKPQKMNQEIMNLYKEHKVNPMAGCLPMLVQIPVFIALFIVLRSAVELRFAPFLWVSDLSEPEGILASVLPFGGLNILPLLMTATTVWQQKVTPSAADPQQQKIMMMMPVIMLFLFYNMPSALLLYWTVSQLLAILQLVWQKKGPETTLVKV